MSNSYTFKEVMDLAETNPSEQIWCISNDGRVDFITTAEDIKKTVYNFDWDGVEFMKINNEDGKTEDNQNDEITFTRKKIKHQVQMFKSNNLADLMTMVNQFLENIEDIIKIDYQIGQSNTIGLLSLEYSVMVHYIES